MASASAAEIRFTLVAVPWQVSSIVPELSTVYTTIAMPPLMAWVPVTHEL